MSDKSYIYLIVVIFLALVLPMFYSMSNKPIKVTCKDIQSGVIVVRQNTPLPAGAKGEVLKVKDFQMRISGRCSVEVY